MATTPVRLVINGCSYMQCYADGNGHGDLAAQLKITQHENLAEPGACNNRIIRTTLRDSFVNPAPTLYVIGVTFVSRYELPVNKDRVYPDGKWLSFTTSGLSHPSTVVIDPCVCEKDLDWYQDIWLKINLTSFDEWAEDLQYRLLSMCDSLNRRGHSCIVFNTAEAVLDYVLDQSKFQPMKSQRQIIDGLKWKSIPWQFDQGAAWLPNDERHDRNCRHVAPGQHQWLNQYLTNYIQEYTILQ